MVAGDSGRVGRIAVRLVMVGLKREIGTVINPVLETEETLVRDVAWNLGSAASSGARAVSVCLALIFGCGQKETEFYLCTDGQYSDWSEWTSCSVTCGPNGQQQRKRNCTSPSLSHEGATCNGHSTESQSCSAKRPCAQGKITSFITTSLF